MSPAILHCGDKLWHRSRAKSGKKCRFRGLAKQPNLNRSRLVSTRWINILSNSIFRIHSFAQVHSKQEVLRLILRLVLIINKALVRLERWPCEEEEEKTHQSDFSRGEDSLHSTNKPLPFDGLVASLVLGIKPVLESELDINNKLELELVSSWLVDKVDPWVTSVVSCAPSTLFQASSTEVDLTYAENEDCQNSYQLYRSRTLSEEIKAVSWIVWSTEIENMIGPTLWELTRPVWRNSIDFRWEGSLFSNCQQDESQISKSPSSKYPLFPILA